jgi:hypothetical protein
VGSIGDGEYVTFALYGVAGQTLDFDDDDNAATGYVGSTTLPLPTTTVAGQTSIFTFRYNASTSTWQFVGTNTPTGTLPATLMPAFTGAITTTAGTVASTLAAPYQRRSCEIHIWGTGAAGVLADTDDEIVSCYNDTGVTVHIVAIRCWANAGSPTVFPIKTGGGDLLTGNLTCGTAAWANGNLHGTSSNLDIANAGTIDANIVAAGGVATNLRLVITYTVPAS